MWFEWQQLLGQAGYCASLDIGLELRDGTWEGVGLVGVGI